MVIGWESTRIITIDNKVTIGNTIYATMPYLMDNVCQRERL